MLRLSVNHASDYITNQPLRFYQGYENLTMQEEYYNMRINLGVKFDLSYN